MLPKKSKIIKIEKENSNTSLLTFDISLKNASPGQFVMVWLPGVDEKPMSIAANKPNLQLSIAKLGAVSTKLAESKANDILYIRGPYGKPFAPLGKRWILVGGGCGFAPLRYLAYYAKENKIYTESIIGARTADLCMLPAPGKNHITTDDGSKGVKGNVLVALEPLLKKENNWDCVYCCGPEKMMLAVAQMVKKYKIPSQLSVERYMKCGFGICGHCAMGGWLACKDGPTITGEEALANSEFGKCYCDKAGRKKEI
ncbi:MAG: dihydroorotate dehydrogenase electron transfer subunit [Candidatus Micrarchaeota archaeon]